MGLFKTPTQKQAIYILEMIDEMGKIGRQELREELELTRSGLIELRDKLEIIARGGSADLTELNKLERIVEDIYEDNSEDEDDEDY